MALTAQQANTARMLVQLAERRGASPRHAREFASAALAESGLNPGARNRSSGAGGLFQLLSPGYVRRAQARGGVNNPRANALAILPDYLRYWQSHPGARPGEAGAAVERSGEGAGFYAKGLPQIPQVGGGVAASQVPLTPGARPTPPGLAAAPDIQPQLLAALSQQVGEKTPDYTQVFGLLRQKATQEATQHVATLRATAQRQAVSLARGVQTAAPGLKVPPGAARVIGLAKRYMGLPYKWGGTNPKTGFDCSGFVQWLYGHAGVHLPRTSQEQFRTGRAVAKSELQAGDLVFFEGSPSGPGHVGLYIGAGQFIESPHTGAGIRISRLAGRTDYVGARRVQLSQAGGRR